MKQLAWLALAACAHHAAGTVTPDGSAPAGDAAVPADAAVTDAAPWHAHADAATASLLLHYWTPSYLDAASPHSGTDTGYWTFAQAWDAVLDGAERTGGAKFGGWIEGLYLAQAARGWSSNYYDDENWMTLALVRAYDLAGDAKYLAEAKALYADIEAAWDTSCCGAAPGGIWWDRAHTQKATASNAGPVIAGVRLAARTGDASYLAFAQQVYAYWRANMVDPTTFAVTDHVTTGGQLVHYKFTYNEGLMIGAAVALYGATNDARYLADAHAIAGYMLAHETRAGILFDGDNTHCTGDCAQFKGIGFRYLSALQAVDPAPDVAAVLAASAQSAWSAARGAGDLFATDWAGPPATPTPIDAESSAAMTLNLYAESLGAAPPPASARYQAEDGVVHAIGLEASHAGFDGWGYLAGWNADGQWVDFRVTVPAAGMYTLTIGYAAGAGDASRLVFANGGNAVPNLALPSTGSWDTWATQTARVQLPTGTSTLSIIYNSSAGSSNYVNLDWITVD